MSPYNSNIPSARMKANDEDDLATAIDSSSAIDGDQFRDDEGSFAKNEIIKDDGRIFDGSVQPSNIDTIVLFLNHYFLSI